MDQLLTLIGGTAWEFPLRQLVLRLVMELDIKSCYGALYESHWAFEKNENYRITFITKACTQLEYNLCACLKHVINP